MTDRNRPRHLFRWLIVLLAGLILITIAIFGVWAAAAPEPGSAAMTALQSDAMVSVNQDPWSSFSPPGEEPTTGIILYPGGRVPAEAYAPIARQIANQGYLVVLPSMPLNFAVFAPEVAAEIMSSHPEIMSWVLAGHSLGGAMAARYASRHPQEVDGLVLLAAYPAASDDLSQADVPVLSIFGTSDDVATPEEIEASASLLPADTTWVAIPGGNHAQFGDYGLQSGDGTATISPQDQWQRTTAAILEFVAGL